VSVEEISFDDLDLDFGTALPALAGSAVKRFADADPSEIALYPPTFPVEIALQTAPLPDILASYAIDLPRWEALQKHPVFVRDLGAALEAVKKHGMSFKMKAGLQAEAMLERMWEMAHAPFDEVPPAVQADLMKFVVKAAGLDASKDQAGHQQGTPLQININLG
jgi:hypothetical protein